MVKMEEFYIYLANMALLDLPDEILILFFSRLVELDFNLYNTITVCGRFYAISLSFLYSNIGWRSGYLSSLTTLTSLYSTLHDRCPQKRSWVKSGNFQWQDRDEGQKICDIVSKCCTMTAVNP